jgi:hypothetical protein
MTLRNNIKTMNTKQRKELLKKTKYFFSLLPVQAVLAGIVMYLVLFVWQYL